MAQTNVTNKSIGQSRPTINLETCQLTAEDALKCLANQVDVIIPIPNVRPCNNLEDYFFKSTINTPKSNKTQVHPTSSKKSTELAAPFAVPLVRNFEKVLKKTDNQDQSDLGFIRRPLKKRPDVFSRTEQMNASTGPLMLLKDRMGSSVKVIIRRRRKVPFISRVIEYKGTLVLFDKHMNLYLKDVIESFVYKVGEKTLKRARHRENILLRGDNVILVS